MAKKSLHIWHHAISLIPVPANKHTGKDPLQIHKELDVEPSGVGKHITGCRMDGQRR